MIGRRMVAVGVVAAAVTVGGVAGAVIGIPGLSGASSSPNSATTAQSNDAPSAGPHFRGFGGPAIGADRDVLDAAAKALNLSTQDLLKKLGDGKTTIADVATQQKVDVNTVIAAMEKVSDSDISNLVNNPFPTRPSFGKGPIGPSGATGVGGPTMGGLGFGFGLRGGIGGLGGSIDSISKSLNISSQDLMKDLAGGQSIADIAKTKSVDVNTIITTLVNDATTKINAEVKAGHIKQDLATKLEANLKDEITKLVNGSLPKGFGHFGGFGKRGGHPGFGPGGPSFAGPPMGGTPKGGSPTTAAPSSATN